MAELVQDIQNRSKSASADAALRTPMQRIAEMTVEERVKTALSMRERFSWVKCAPKAKESMSDKVETNLSVAEHIVSLLEARNVPVVVIGAALEDL